MRVPSLATELGNLGAAPVFKQTFNGSHLILLLVLRQ